jgi:hypothetical protein
MFSQLKNVEGKGLEKTIGAYPAKVHSAFQSYIKGGYSLHRAQNSTGGEPQKNIPIFAIHFKVTIEIAIVSRRSKLEH